MENLFLYILKLTVCSGILFLYYQLALKDKTFHHYNRFYLLMTMLVSMFLPLLKIQDFTIEVSNRIYLLLEQIQQLETPKNNDNDSLYFRIIFLALGLVSFFFVGKILFGIFRIQKLKNSFKKEQIKGINFYQTDLIDAPFSYFRNLFWRDTITLDSDIGKQILKHEMVHIEQRHSIDKIIAEAVTAVFWFNPFFYLIKKEISLIHEYLADHKAVEKKDTKAFAQMLLTSRFSVSAVPAASPFLNSNLKKRLKMLQKTNTKSGYARRVLALPVVFTLAFAYLVNAKNKEIKATNIEIEKAVADLKRDTIAPKNETERIVKLQQEKISKANEKLKIQSEKLKTLSEKSKEKATELQKIAKEKGGKSYDFELKAKELKQLSGEMDKIVKDSQYPELGSIMDINDEIMIKDLKAKFPEIQNRIDIKSGIIDLGQLFDSKEFQEKLNLSDEKLNAKKDLNLENFRNQLTKLNKLNINGVNVLADPKNVEKIVKAYSESATKGYRYIVPSDIKLAPGADAFLNKKESPENAKKRAELDKKAAKLNQKRAKLDSERAKLEIERRMLDGKTGMIIKSTKQLPNIYKSGFFNNNSNNTSYINPKNINLPTGENIKIYIDDKESTNEDFKKMGPSEIKSITITKNNTDGKTSGTINIETKNKL